MADSTQRSLRLRSLAGLLTLVFALLPGLSALARTVRIDLGDSRDNAIEMYAQKFGVSPETAGMWLRHQERQTGKRILDDTDLPEGAVLDFVKVRNSGDPTKRVEFQGRGQLVYANSYLGRHWKEVLFGLVDTAQRREALALLRQAREHGFMVLPAALGGMLPVKSAAVQTVRVLVIIPEFPGWRDTVPRPGSHTTDHYYSSLLYGSNDGVRDHAFRDFGVPLEWDPDEYCDGPGGPITYDGQPDGLAAGAWTTTADPIQGGGQDPAYIATGRHTDLALHANWDKRMFSRTPNNDLLPTFKPWSLWQWFYENTHGHISLEGTAANILGWLQSHHILDRLPQHSQYGSAPAIQPATPALRATDSTQPLNIVRASIDADKCTVFVNKDVPGANDSPTVALERYRIRCVQSVRSSYKDGDGNTVNEVGDYWVTIGSVLPDWARSDVPYAGDQFDHRRVTFDLRDATYDPNEIGPAPHGGTWTVPSSGRLDYVVHSGQHWSVWVRAAGETTSTWQDGSTGYQTQNHGSGGLTNTTFSTSDILEGDLASVAHPGNELLSFYYYIYDHEFSNPPPSGSAYQLAHLMGGENNAYVDDVGGTYDSPSQRVVRPYPYDHDFQDRSKGYNGGNLYPHSLNPDETAMQRRHSSDAMVADVQDLLNNQYPGWNTAYDRYIYTYPWTTGSSANESSLGTPIIPHGGGNQIVVPESAGLYLLAHELMHTFGALDLYDNHFYSNMRNPQPPYFESMMMGPYSIMAFGGVRQDAWHKLRQSYNGERFAVSVPVTEDSQRVELPMVEGTLRDPQILKLPANPLAAYAAHNSAPAGVDPTHWANLANPTQWKEYYLLENRFRTGSQYFDDPSPVGLYIYHIDERNIGWSAWSPNPYGFQVNENAPTVIVEQADGRFTLENTSRSTPNSDLTGDPFPGATGTQTSFTQLTTPSSLSHGRSTASYRQLQPDTATDSFVRIVNITSPQSTMTADVFVEPKEVIVTAESITEGPDVDQGAIDVPYMRLTFNNNGTWPNLSTGPVTIDSLRVLEAGTSEDPNNLLAVKLYEDDGDGDFDPGTAERPQQGGSKDALIQTTGLGAHAPGVAAEQDYALFRNLGFRIDLNVTRDLYIVYDISPEAVTSPEITLGAEISYAEFILPVAPGAVQERVRRIPQVGDTDFADYNNGAGPDNSWGTPDDTLGYTFGSWRFPVASQRTRVIDTSDLLRVEAADLMSVPPRVSDTIRAGASRVPAMHFTLTTAENSLAVEKIIVTNFGTAVDAQDVSTVEFYEDTNGDGQIDTNGPPSNPNNFVGAAGFVAGKAEVTLSPSLFVSSVAAKNLIMTFSLTNTATAGRTVQFRLEAAPAAGQLGSFRLVGSSDPPGPTDDIVDYSNFPHTTSALTIISGNRSPYTCPDGTKYTPRRPGALGYNYDAEWTITDETTGTTTSRPTTAQVSDPTPVLQFPRARGASPDPTPQPPYVGDDGMDPDDPEDPLNPATPGNPDSTYNELSYIVELSRDSAFPENPPDAVLEFTVPPAAATDPGPDGHGPAVRTLTIPTALSVGIWYWRVRAIDAEGANSANSMVWQFEITYVPEGPTPPVLIYPIDDVTASVLSPVYEWTLGTDDATPQSQLVTQVEVDDNDDFSSLKFRAESLPGAENASGWTVTLGSDTLTRGVHYYWRARTRDAEGNWSTWVSDSFWVGDNLQPTPPQPAYIPSDDAIVTTANPTLSFRQASDPDPEDAPANFTYEIELDDEADWTDVPRWTGTVDPPITTNPITLPLTNAVLGFAGLDDDGQYFWRARTRDRTDATAATSDWTATLVFWVNLENDPPLAPSSGFVPADATRIDDTTPQLSCSATVDPDPLNDPDPVGQVAAYQFSLKYEPADPGTWDPGADFDYQYTAGAPTATATTILTDPNPDGRWYWAVRARDDVGEWSPWSTALHFRLNRAPQPPPSPDAEWSPADGEQVSVTPTFTFPVGNDPDTEDPADTLTYVAEFSQDGFATVARTVNVTPAPRDADPVSFTAGAAFAVGNWSWRVRTVDDAGLASVNSAVHTFVTNTGPTAPTGPFSPTSTPAGSGNTVVSDNTPTYSWTIGTDAETPAAQLVTIVQVDDNADFSSPLFEAWSQPGAADSVGWTVQPGVGAANETLSRGVHYYWRAQTRDAAGTLSGWTTAVLDFTVGQNLQPSAPVLRAPINSVEISTANPTMQWNSSTDPDPEDPQNSLIYEIQLSKAFEDDSVAVDWANDVWWSSGELDESDLGTFAGNPISYALTAARLGFSGLTDNRLYYWRMRARDNGHEPGDNNLYSNWSTVGAFWVNIGNEPPEKPIAISPINGDVTDDLTPTLVTEEPNDPDPSDGSDVGAPPTYLFRVKRFGAGWDPSGGDYDYQYASNTFTVDVATALTAPGETWYWSVQAIDDQGMRSAWSDPAMFTLDNAPTPPPTPAPTVDTEWVPVDDEYVVTTPTFAFPVGADPDANDTLDTLTYVVEFSDDNFATIARTVNVTPNPRDADPVTFVAGAPFAVGYWSWRVRTVDDAGVESGNSAVHTFSTNTTPTPPAPSYYPSGGIQVSTTPTYSWTVGTDPETPSADLITVVEVDDNADFSSLKFRAISLPGAGDATGWALDAGFTTGVDDLLVAGIHYYWRALTREDLGGGLVSESPWTATQDFWAGDNIQPTPPNPVYAPANDVVITTGRPTLQFQAATDPDVEDQPADFTYQIQLDDDADWANANLGEWQIDPPITTDPITLALTAAVMPAELEDNKQYFWRARTIDRTDATAATSDWTVTQSFWVNLANQAPLAPSSGFSPSAGERLDDTTPVLICDATVDPDPPNNPDPGGQVAAYQFRLKYEPADPLNWDPGADYDYQYTAANPSVNVTSPLSDPLPNGRWFWAVRARDAFGAWSPWSVALYFQLNRAPTPPPTPGPTVDTDWVPANGAVVEPQPDCQFPAGDDADEGDEPANLRYVAEFSQDPTFSAVLPQNTYTVLPDAADPSVLNFQVTNALGTGTWYWRVQTIDDAGLESAYSQVHNFVVDNPPTPPNAPFSPSGNSDSGRSPVFQWVLGSDPDPADLPSTLVTVLEVDDNADFSSPEYGGEIASGAGEEELDTGLLVLDELRPGVTYYWRAKTRDQAGLESAWAATQTFTVVDNTAPSAPRNMWPTNGEERDETQPTIYWDPATDPDDAPADLRYVIQLDDDDDWSDATLWEGTADGTDLRPDGRVFVQVSTALDDNEMYYYRIKTIDPDNQESDWSATRNFWINTENNPPNAPTTGFAPTNGEIISSLPTVLRCAHTTDPDPNDPTWPGGPYLTYIYQMRRDAAPTDADYTYQYTVQATTPPNVQAYVQTFVNDDLGADDPDSEHPWYWRVRAQDDQGLLSPWSTVQYFYLDTQNQPPTLAPAGSYAQALTPKYGKIAPPSHFSFQVVYTDEENDAPVQIDEGGQLGAVWVEIDGNAATRRPMQKLDDTDNNYADGAAYIIGMNADDAALGIGMHTFRFYTASWTVQWPPADPFNPPATFDLWGDGPIIGTDSTLAFTDGVWDAAAIPTPGTPPDPATEAGYEEGVDVIRVQLHDPDKAGRGTLTVTLTTDPSIDPQDTETLTLTEDLGQPAGTFRGQMQVRGVAEQPGDPESALPDGDPGRVLNVLCEGGANLVTVEYTDPDEGADFPNSMARDITTDEVLVVDTVAPPAIDADTLVLATGVNQYGNSHGRSIDVSWAGYLQPGPPSNQVDIVGYEIYLGAAGPFAVEQGAGGVVLNPANSAVLVTTAGPGATNYTITGAEASLVAANIDLDPNGQYHIVVVPVDEAGLRDLPAASEAVGTLDTQHPVLRDEKPANGTDEVPLTTTISFRLVEPGSGIDESTLQVFVERVPGATWYDIAADPDGLGWRRSAAGTLADRTYTFTFVPTDPDADGFFGLNQDVNVRVVCSDVDGNQLDSWNPVAPFTQLFSFSMKSDLNPPAIINKQPAPDSDDVLPTTPITFTITDDIAGVDTDSLVVQVNGAVVDPADLTIDDADPMSVDVSYTPAAGEVPWGAEATVDVSVDDKAGNNVTDQWKYNTQADADAPAVAIAELSPAAGATNVPIETSVSFRITDELSGIATLAGGDWDLQVFISVNGGAETQIPHADLAFSGTSRSLRVTYDPAANFTYNDVVKLRVVTRDVAGNAISEEDPPLGGQGFEWSFTCEAPPTYRIAGTIVDQDNKPLPGVRVRAWQQGQQPADGEQATTDGNGTYIILIQLGGTFTVEPELSEYVFAPVNTQVTVNGADVTNQDFVGTLQTYSLSGQVLLGGNALAGVTVSTTLNSATISAVTDATGNYTIAGLPSGRYQITPALVGYTFRPAGRTRDIAGAPVTGVDFEAVANTYTISGTVRNYDGDRMVGVRVTDGTRSTVTNDSGEFTLNDVPSGTVEVVATKTGYKLLPEKQTVTVPPAATGIDFTAYVAFANSFPAGEDVVNLIGVPCYPADTDPLAVFGARSDVVRWDPLAVPPDYVRAQTGVASTVLEVQPGRGFFTRLKKADPADNNLTIPNSDLEVGGRPVSTSRDFTLSLGPVWNMSANPFTTALPFANMTPGVAGSVRNYGYVYDPGVRNYLLVSSLAGLNVSRTYILPWEGLWLRTSTSSATLRITPPTGTADVPAAPQALELGTGGWAIPIIARAGGSADTTTAVGVGPGLSGAFQLENPPMAPQSVDVYLNSADGRFLAQDVKPDASAQAVWTMTVATDIPGADVQVSLPDLSRVPNDMAVYLTDLTTNKRMYARTMAAYTFTAGDGGAKRDFKIEVLPRTEAGLVISSAAAAAGARATAITFNVSKSCTVTAEITNIAGRVVKRLCSDRDAVQGVNTLNWDLTTDRGTRVPNGRYMIRISAAGEDGQQVSAVTTATVSR